MGKTIEQSALAPDAVTSQTRAPNEALSDVLAHVQGHMHRQAERLNDHCVDLLDRLGALQQIDLSFGMKLASCRSPAEAIALCGEWTNRRFDALAAMQRRLLDSWCPLMVEPAPTTSKDAGKR